MSAPVVKSKYSGRYLYAIVYEEWYDREWHAKMPEYIYADSQGEARWYFTRNRGVTTNILAIGLCVGFKDSGKKDLVVSSGIRADEYKPRLVA